MHTQQDSDAALQNNLTISEKSVVPYTHSSGYAIASLILGIISSALACVPILSTICSILGIVFVIKVRKQEKVFHNGLVTAGLILCICGFVLSLLFLAYWIWYLFVFLCTVETQPHHEAPPPMPKYHGHPAKFLFPKIIRSYSAACRKTSCCFSVHSIHHASCDTLFIKYSYLKMCRFTESPF